MTTTAIIPANQDYFECFKVVGSFRNDHDGKLSFAVAAFYTGPVIAWQITRSANHDGYLVPQPITPLPSLVPEDDYPSPREDKMAIIWRDTRTDIFFTKYDEPLFRDSWIQACQHAFHSVLSRDEYEKALALPWHCCEPPQGPGVFRPTCPPERQ